MGIFCWHTVPGMEGMGVAMVCCVRGAFGGCKGGMDMVTVVSIVGYCCHSQYTAWC